VFKLEQGMCLELDGNESGKWGDIPGKEKTKALIPNMMELWGEITNTQSWFQMQN